MKKKKRNFIIKIFSLLLLGIISVTLLGSWTYNPSTDTITSDNISNYSRGNLTENGITSSIENNKIIANGTSDNAYGVINIYSGTLQAGTYTISITPFENWVSYYQWYTEDWSIDVKYQSITLSSTTNLMCRIITTGGITLTNYEAYIMLNEGLTPMAYEPYGQTYINNTRYENLELDYEELYDNYQNLNDDYQTLQSNYSALQQNYNNLQSQYEDLQQQISDLNSQIAELSKISSNLYNLFYHCDIYVFNGSTNKGIEYYASHLSEANSSFMHYVLSSTAISFNYENLPDYIRTFISSSEDYCFVLFKFNNTDLNGLYNIFFNDYTFDFEVQLFNDVTNQKYTYNMLNNGSLSNAIVIDTNNILYNYMLFDTTMDYHFTKFYTSDFTNVYNQGYENGIRQNYLVIDDLRSQVKIANNTITSLRRQIDNLNEQLANNIGWKPLFFAMADTPFKVVSNVLGFEVFGVNLFKVFVGIITGLAIIWLLKKLLGK